MRRTHQFLHYSAGDRTYPVNMQVQLRELRPQPEAAPADWPLLRVGALLEMSASSSGSPTLWQRGIVASVSPASAGAATVYSGTPSGQSCSPPPILIFIYLAAPALAGLDNSITAHKCISVSFCWRAAVMYAHAM